MQSVHGVNLYNRNCIPCFYSHWQDWSLNHSTIHHPHLFSCLSTRDPSRNTKNVLIYNIPLKSILRYQKTYPNTISSMFQSYLNQNHHSCFLGSPAHTSSLPGGSCCPSIISSTTFFTLKMSSLDYKLYSHLMLTYLLNAIPSILSIAKKEA